MLKKLFFRQKHNEEKQPENPPKATVDFLLRQTAGELRTLGMMYAMASIAAEDERGIVALRSASLRLEKLARQFQMTADLFANGQIDED